MATINRLFERMSAAGLECTRSAYISFIKARKLRTDEGRSMMIDSGYEESAADGPVLQDGRDVVELFGKKWALRPDVHAERVRIALELAQENAATRRAERQPDSEEGAAVMCLQLIDDQLCGGNITRESVCPRCALGRRGVVATLTCDVCGAVTAVMRSA